MPINIERLLNKKVLRGEEVGKALMASIINDIKYQDKPNYAPLFSQAEFEKMESTLSTEKDYLVYDIYRSIYSSLIDAYNRGQARYQQFSNGYYCYAMCIKDAMDADNMVMSAEFIPYVMTEEQYNKLKERTETRLKGFTDSFSTLLYTILFIFMESPEDAPEDIRYAIEATKTEAVTNARILSSYNKTHGRGYYQLPDGTRSDQLQEAEWKERLKVYYPLYVNGERASWEDTALHYNSIIRLKYYELFFNGIDAVRDFYKEHSGEELPQKEEAGIMQALEILISFKDKSVISALENGTAPIHPALAHITLTHIKGFFESELACGAEWHYYESPPTDLTKHDILCDMLEKSEFFNSVYTEGGKPHLTEFKADYPALYKILEAYIKKLVPQAKNLKPSQYDKDFISRGELADLGIQKFIMLTTANEYDITEFMAQEDEDKVTNHLKRRRILLNGINIAKEPKAFHLNKNGDYIDNIDEILLRPNMNSVERIAESERERKDIVAFQEHLFKPALRYLYAFNTLLRILGTIYDIEEIVEVELKTTLFEQKLDTLNYTLYGFYAKAYGTQEEKDRKRALIKEIFSPVNYQELKPTQEAIVAVTAELKGLGFSNEAKKRLKKFDDLIDRLCGKGL